MTERDLLFSYFVSGEEYQEYIPLVLHSIQVSYPRATVVIGCRERLTDSVRLMLQQYPPVVAYNIHEGVGQEYPNTTFMRMLQRLIWIAPEHRLFPMVYESDIDLLIVPEPVPLWQQHLAVCEERETCYSNTDKIDVPHGSQMTGLHFYLSEEYLSAVEPILEPTLQWLREGRIPEAFWHPQKGEFNAQRALLEIIRMSGLKMPEHSFFRYHGLHLGHSRFAGRWFKLWHTEPDHVAYLQSYWAHLREGILERALASTGPTERLLRELSEMEGAWTEYQSA